MKITELDLKNAVKSQKTTCLYTWMCDRCVGGQQNFTFFKLSISYYLLLLLIPLRVYYCAHTMTIYCSKVKGLFVTYSSWTQTQVEKGVNCHSWMSMKNEWWGREVRGSVRGEWRWLGKGWRGQPMGWRQAKQVADGPGAQENTRKRLKPLGLFWAAWMCSYHSGRTTV